MEKIIPTVEQVKSITSPYDTCLLECDGMTNVLHFYLSRADIVHEVYAGGIVDRLSGEAQSYHMWIVLETEIGEVTVDYRARMWLGNKPTVPHGVFLQDSYPHIHYEGKRVAPRERPEQVITALVNKKHKDDIVMSDQQGNVKLVSGPSLSHVKRLKRQKR